MPVRTTSLRIAVPTRSPPISIGIRCWAPRKALIDAGALTPAEVLERYEAKRTNVIELAGEVGGAATARQRGSGDETPAGRPGGSRRRVPGVPGRGGEVRRPGRAVDPCARDQPCAARHPGSASGGDDLRRGHRPQGGRVRRHARTSRQEQFRRGCSTRCSTSSRSSVSRSAPESRGCCRSRRSSTSPTFTTPRTRFAARVRRCSSSPTGSTAIRWWSGWQATDTRRGSAGTFTTMTPSRRSVTSPES